MQIYSKVLAFLQIYRIFLQNYTCRRFFLIKKKLVLLLGFFQTMETHHQKTGVRYHLGTSPLICRATSPLICRANQGAGFYMITASVMKELKAFHKSVRSDPRLFSLSLIFFHFPINTSKQCCEVKSFLKLY